ncbi:RNA polymerase sigma factor [Hymenobacter rubidus]|uniref:RNA polymerase sigma factor n=1 Tax=Hymenobacter rubidus TaxID=1441626 RepID=UPI00191DD35F|nr:sigma-70 family RNA polymerase sigma factor [Hymenobacter rubidus]
MTLLPPSPPPASALRDALLADREQALTRLYRRAFPLVRRYVGSHGGTAQDAQDIFHDAMVILYEQAVGGTLVLTSSAGTYLVGIARNLWHHEQRRRARLPEQSLSDAFEPLASEDSEAVTEPAIAVLDYVERLGKKCKDVLLSFYYFQQPLTQIAESNGYASVRSATVQKFKCLERLRSSVRAAWRSETLEL